MTPTSSTKVTAPKQLVFKALLLAEPALDPPVTTATLNRGTPQITQMSPTTDGVFILCANGRSYIIPWANIRHAEVNVG